MDRLVDVISFSAIVGFILGLILGFYVLGNPSKPEVETPTLQLLSNCQKELEERNQIYEVRDKEMLEYRQRSKMWQKTAETWQREADRCMEGK